MVLNIYSIYDSKAEAFEAPFFIRSRGEALRGWIDVVADTNTKFNKHPGDYTLFELGSFDCLSGQFNSLKAKYSLGTGLEVLPKSSDVKVSNIR